MITKNKNTVKQAVLEAIQMKNAIKEESKNILKDMLSETVKDAIRESIEDDEEENDSYEVVDDDAQADDTVEEPETDSEDEEEPESDKEEEKSKSDEDEWDNYSDYQAGDENTYDLTGVEDYDQIVKVYKLMKDDDQVVVKQDGDKIELTDNETGNEYVISLGMNAEDGIEGDGEEQDVTTENIVKEDADIAGIPNTDA